MQGGFADDHNFLSFNLNNFCTYDAIISGTIPGNIFRQTIGKVILFLFHNYLTKINMTQMQVGDQAGYVNQYLATDFNCSLFFCRPVAIFKIRP